MYSPVGRHKNATRKQTKGKHQKHKQTHKPKTNKNSNKRPSRNKRDKFQFMLIMQEVITLYHLNLVWQKKQTEEQTKITRPYQKVSEATNVPCGNQGSPQPGSPRSHGTSRQGITNHLWSLRGKQRQRRVATRVVRKLGEKEGETRANVKKI